MLLLKLAWVLGGDPIEKPLGQVEIMEQHAIFASDIAPYSLRNFTDGNRPIARGITWMNRSMDGWKVIHKAYSQERFN